MPLPGASNPFAQILSVLVTQVANALQVSTSYVRPVASDDYAITEAENLFAYIRAYGPTPVDGRGTPFNDIGAGRSARLVGRRVRVYIYTRSGVDTYGGDEIALMGSDPTVTPLTTPSPPGQFAAEEVVLNALDDFFPTTSNTGLTIGPVHWIDSSDGPPVRRPENEEGLIRSHLDFQVVYISSVLTLEPMTPISAP